MYKCAKRWDFCFKLFTLFTLFILLFTQLKHNSEKVLLSILPIICSD